MTTILILSALANLALAYLASKYRKQASEQKQVLSQWNQYADKLEYWITALVNENEALIEESDNLSDYVAYLESDTNTINVY